MNALRAVFMYEWKRSLTAGRIAWWLVMAAFPAVLTVLIRAIPGFDLQMREAQRDNFWSMTLYFLVPCVCSALSVLLTAGPAIAAELEQRSWVYMATRPNGIFWLLIGKYLVAVTWGFTAAVVGASTAVVFANAVTPVQVWIGLVALSFLSCVSYSAVYLLVGVISPKRAMVFCVMYTGFVEVVLGFIPALVNRLTVQFRLRSLLVQWMPLNDDVRQMPSFSYVFGEGSAFLHCFWLLTLVVLFLAAALTIAHRKEFTTASEGDL
jgi:ABC-type transport system involved in multi-copper enzyme maturation permease subunit